MMVPVRTGDGQFEAGVPKLLFGLQLPPVTRNRVVGVGKGRFLVNMLTSRSVQGSMTVPLNWPALLCCQSSAVPPASARLRTL